MNTPENRIRIEPPSLHKNNTPTALLDAGGDAEAEMAEPTEASPAFSTVNILEDTGGYHLTALDDW